MPKFRLIFFYFFLTLFTSVTTYAGAKDKNYLRSYVDRENKAQNTRFVTGIKYPDQDVYNNYREIYLKFAKSLKQFAD